MTSPAPAAAPAIKLFLADVDGTLVTERKVLTTRAIAAVHRLGAAGIRFAVTSGRPPRGMAMLVEPLGLTGVIAGFNGGAFVNPDQSVVLSRTLDPAAARRAYDAMRGHGLDAWVYTAQDWLIRDPAAPHVDREARTVQFGPTVVPDPAAGLDRAVKVVGCSDDLELVRRCEAGVQAALGGTVSAARSQPYYLDVTHPDANKGAVVAYLAQHYDIAPHEVATIGDMPNDVLMFRPSGLSIAMGQASQEVRGAATHVTDGYDDEGFAKAVDRFIFGDAA